MTGPDAPRTTAEFADIVAMQDSGRISALPTHRVIATHLWRTLRTLGFESGRVLVHGDDPETFLGQPHTQGFGYTSLTATVGPAHRPGSRIHAAAITDLNDEDFDLVIAALPFNDVKLTHPVHQVRRRVLEDALTLACVEFTKPGGITVVLASHDLLDDPDPRVRRKLATQADLVGAVRLPGGVQRNVAGTDAAADLILWHRRLDGEPPQGPRFTAAAPVIVDGHVLLHNTYFDERPDHVLGAIGLDPLAYRPNVLTVTGDPTRFAENLGSALDDIAIAARRAGIVYSADPTRLNSAPLPERQAAGGAGVSPAMIPEEHDEPDPFGLPAADPENLGDTGVGLW